jgi:hypothetical protein
MRPHWYANRTGAAMAAGNPFDDQRPLTRPADLIDRMGELDALQRAAADEVAIRLASPRRFGKTSLLHVHLDAMREAGHRTSYVDSTASGRSRTSPAAWSTASGSCRRPRAPDRAPPQPPRRLHRHHGADRAGRAAQSGPVASSVAYVFAAARPR